MCLVCTLLTFGTSVPPALISEIRKQKPLSTCNKKYGNLYSSFPYASFSWNYCSFIVVSINLTSLRLSFSSQIWCREVSVYKSLFVLESPLTDVPPILKCVHVRADNFLNYITQLYLFYGILYCCISCLLTFRMLLRWKGILQFNI